MELPAHLADHLLGRAAHSTHGQTTEQKRGHGTEKRSDEDTRVHQVDLEEVHEVGHCRLGRVKGLSGGIEKLSPVGNGAAHGQFDLLDIRGEQRQCSESC